MTLKFSPQLRSLPVQFIELPQGLILKRGATELRLEGEGASTAAQLIFSAARNRIRTQEILALFAPVSRPIVERLVQTLLSKGFLVTESRKNRISPKQESPQDVFYWHFGQQTKPFLQSLNRTFLSIVGVNFLSKHIAAALQNSGIKNFRVVDHPLLRQERLFSKNGSLKKTAWPQTLKNPLSYDTWMRRLKNSSPQCLVVTSDFGPSPVIREMNHLAHQYRLATLPVVLHNMIGLLGPFILPGETACYECLSLRQNSHQDHVSVVRAIENHSFHGQGIVGFHPLMVAILASQAVLELIKFHGNLLPPQSMGHLIEMDFLSSRLSLRKILKVPRCPVCSPMYYHGSTMTKKIPSTSAGDLTP